MIIALDYDYTYTADPELWNDFIDKAMSRNHKVICVTMRYEKEGKDVLNSVGQKCHVIFTSRQAKLEYLRINYNFKPDIWIDDNPMWVYTNA